MPRSNVKVVLRTRPCGSEQSHLQLDTAAKVCAVGRSPCCSSAAASAAALAGEQHSSCTELSGTADCNDHERRQDWSWPAKQQRQIRTPTALPGNAGSMQPAHTVTHLTECFVCVCVMLFAYSGLNIHTSASCPDFQCRRTEISTSDADKNCCR